jgi:hypothetical protein
MVWEEVAGAIAGLGVLGALGITGDVVGGINAGMYVYRWIAPGEDIEKIVDGKRVIHCGICGEPGHNRRTCDENEVCGCGNEDADEIWENDGARVCDECS